MAKNRKLKGEPEPLGLFPDFDFGEPKTKDKADWTAKVTEDIPVKRTTEVPVRHYDHTKLFERLAQSDFRRSFHLRYQDMAYIRMKGMDTIRKHAADFVAKRLAPAYIANDGRQTPMRGHPVFVAQHATACCCRGCFMKWHHIPAGRELTPEEQDYAVSVLMNWIEKEYTK